MLTPSPTCFNNVNAGENNSADCNKALNQPGASPLTDSLVIAYGTFFVSSSLSFGPGFFFTDNGARSANAVW
jgi:hypothetical protein